MFRLASDGEPGHAAAMEATHAPAHQRGVLLVNVGTPEAPDVASVRRYLAEFLADPLVIRLPAHLRWLQRGLAWLIARQRASHSAEKYRQIWTERGSPLKAIMEDQAAALAEKLGGDWRVFLGMRYGLPGIAETLRQIAASGIEELVVVPVYPQFSQTTTGTVVQELYRCLKEAGLHLNVTTRTTWYDDGGYINAQAHLIAEYAAAHGLQPSNTILLYSAHGLPVSYVRRGDPYARQLNQTMRLVTERLGWPQERTALAYQSRMGPAEWLKPDTRTMLSELIERNEQRVLICPISFTVDCLETLEEIDIGYRREFEERGGQMFLCPALNDYQRFIVALKNVVVKGPRPVTSWGAGHQPLIDAEAVGQLGDAGLDRLVMVGVSLPGRVGAGQGPRLDYSQPDHLACAKKSHQEVYAFLRALRAAGQASEALIWNTCHRCECYAWLESGGNAAARECAVAQLRQRLFPDEPEGLQVNVLLGAQAWHHLVRTLAGLNSVLPGDKDIVEQFQTAYRLAERAGAADARARHLVDEAVRLARGVRAETAWGRFDRGYCQAALARIHQTLPLQMPNCRHVIVGGSTTSRSILETLYDEFSVKESEVTLVYRNHQGGQVKLLRKAIRHGRRLRTHAYDDRAVLAAVADADVVYFGIDRDEPVLTAEALRGLRDFDERPLTVIDFNTSGSTTGLESLPGVTLWTAEQLDVEVAAYAEALCGSREFPSGVREAEVWIEGRAPRHVKLNLKLPCGAAAANERPHCTDCDKLLEPVGTRSDAQ